MENAAIIIIWGSFFALAARDHLWPAREFPTVRRWPLKGILAFCLSYGVSATVPFVWDDFFAAHRIFDASGLGVLGGAALGFLTLEVGIYIWHRLMHEVDPLFRWIHQMHHSAERLDIFGAYLFHPLDIAGFTLMGSVTLVGLVGVVPEAALMATLVATLLGIFQHANLRTPRWLGYFVQRPESHAIHHQRGLHRYNYADLPLVDMLFGTFRNPAAWEGEVGFHDGASERLLEMALGFDVSEAPESPPTASPVGVQS